jgi:hypothetical protein
MLTIESSVASGSTGFTTPDIVGTVIAVLSLIATVYFGWRAKQYQKSQQTVGKSGLIIGYLSTLAGGRRPQIDKNK